MSLTISKRRLLGQLDTTWMRHAACRRAVQAGWATTDDFYPPRGGSLRKARMICSACPVRAPCAEYGLMAHERFGVWGGLSERERRIVWYRRAVEQAEAS